MPGKDIFLSYASEDRNRILPLVRALERTGWTVFWDRNIPAGKTWRQIIGEEIRLCRSVVVVWSKQSVEKEWVQEEAEEGKRRRILVPVLIDPVEPPFGFGSIQAADLVCWDAAATAPSFQGFVRDLSTLLGPPPVEAEQQRREEAAARQMEVARRRQAQDADQRKQEEDDRRVLEEAARRIQEEKSRLALKAKEERVRQHIVDARHLEEREQRAAEGAPGRAEEVRRHTRKSLVRVLIVVQVACIAGLASCYLFLVATNVSPFPLLDLISIPNGSGLVEVLFWLLLCATCIAGSAMAFLSSDLRVRVQGLLPVALAVVLILWAQLRLNYVLGSLIVGRPGAETEARHVDLLFRWVLFPATTALLSSGMATLRRLRRGGAG